MIELYNRSCNECSRLVTNNYSTSFSMGIKLFAQDFRTPIYNIYGFVRFADEIVDTFHQHDKAQLIEEFRRDTFEAIDRKISLNPILHSFQETVNQYGIDRSLIEAFLESMEMDLTFTKFSRAEYEKYIYGSAEVIGLMCLHVFVQGDEKRYETLRPSAMKLGSAFQKINFLRDIKSDYDERGRIYFPDLDYSTFDVAEKQKIEAEIQQEFTEALEGIRQLPNGARLGVYLAYKYYTKLLKKIKKCSAEEVRKQRIRVPDARKLLLVGTSTLRYQLRVI